MRDFGRGGGETERDVGTEGGEGGGGKSITSRNPKIYCTTGSNELRQRDRKRELEIERQRHREEDLRSSRINWYLIAEAI